MSSSWSLSKSSTKIDIDNRNLGLHSNPQLTVIKSVSQDEVPGKGIKVWFLRLFYWVRTFLWGTAWYWNQVCYKHLTFDGKQIPKRSGEVAVVTGGARGIGSEIVKKLLIADMHVIIGCRDLIAGYELIQRFRTEGLRSGDAECWFLELESLESVRTFASRVLQKYLAINVLINNAGVMIVPFRLTGDGLESHFQINYLSHFLLTVLLIPALRNGGSKNKFSRIVNVSSKVQDLGEIDFDNLLTRKMYSRIHAYSCTKLMQVVSSNFLDDSFKEFGLMIHSHAVHPGIICSDLMNVIPFFGTLRSIFKVLLQRLDQGADGIVYAALSPTIESRGGLFLGNCKTLSHNEEALDKGIQKKLWDVTCNMVGVDKNILQQLGSKGGEIETEIEEEELS